MSTTDVLQFDADQVLSNLAHLAAAFVLAAPIGWNRERHARSAGLRTFPLVALGACAFTLVGRSIFAGSGDPLARIIYGVISGLGFVGGGAILKGGGRVSGTATAASIWNTGAIGVSVALDRFEIAIVLALTNFLILALIPPVKRQLDGVEDDEADD